MHQQQYLDQYHETSVHTVSPVRLVVMMYEGAIRFTDGARIAIENDNIPERGRLINRALSIVQELRIAVDLEQGEHIARQLVALYEFMERQLSLANVEHNADRLKPVLENLRTLHSSWAKIAEGEPANEHAAQAPHPAPDAPAGDGSRLSLSV